MSNTICHADSIRDLPGGQMAGVGVDTETPGCPRTMRNRREFTGRLE
ncbi:MAG TPA: hypothetical protein VGA18_03460 [Rhodothermales bacterium]